jgi:hypothetical protein
MKQNVVLTIASLLSILFMTLHLTDDTVRGMDPVQTRRISEMQTQKQSLFDEG